ncbi:MAG: hypothetical protein QXR53_00490 [Candidatus Norongarragalinales archaeon]
MDVGKLKHERDSARREVRTISVDNRGKISELRSHFSKASELKVLRDKENSLANEFRGKRDSLKEQISASKQKLSQMRGKMRSEGAGRNPAAIQEEVERLEWILQTEDLSPKEEKDLSKKIKDLLKQMPQAQGFQQLLKDYSAERASLGKLIEQEKHFHEKALEHSKKAQAAHGSLIAESKSITSLQQSISKSMELLKEKEGAAEEKHEALVKSVGERKLKEMEERQRELRNEARIMQAQQKKLENKAKAIYDRLKAGEKISREEMMVLQQSGIL